MFHITPFAISGLLIAIPFVAMSVFIFSKEKTVLTRVGALWLLSIGVWGTGAFLIGINQNLKLAPLFWHFAYSGVMFISVLFLHLVYLVFNAKKDVFFYFAYLQAIFFLYLNIRGEMFVRFDYLFGFYFQHGGPYYPASFILFYIVTAYAHLKLFLKYKTASPRQKQQISTLLLAMPFGFGAGAMNFLPGFGIKLFPYGNFLIPLYFFIITYAIFKYQFLDIAIFFKKGILYSILIATLTFVYLMVVLVFEKFFQSVFGYSSISVSVGTAFVVGVLFFPLRNRIQRFVDRRFFKGTAVEIAEQNERLRREVADKEKFKTVAALAERMLNLVENC